MGHEKMLASCHELDLVPGEPGTLYVAYAHVTEANPVMSALCMCHQCHPLLNLGQLTSRDEVVSSFVCDVTRSAVIGGEVVDEHGRGVSHANSFVGYSTTLLPITYIRHQLYTIVSQAYITSISSESCEPILDIERISLFTRVVANSQS